VHSFDGLGTVFFAQLPEVPQKVRRMLQPQRTTKQRTRSPVASASPSAPRTDFAAPASAGA